MLKKTSLTTLLVTLLSLQSAVAGVSLSGSQVLVTGSETIHSLFNSAANSPAGGTGTFMARGFFRKAD